jgi:hypothetical protein
MKLIPWSALLRFLSPKCVRPAAVVLCAILLCAPSGVRASGNGGTGISMDDPPVTIDAQWFFTQTLSPPSFFWDTNGIDLEGAFTFTAPTNVVLNVTDISFTGDQFEIFDFDNSLGLTSTPSDPGFGTTSDPNVAFTSPLYSHGSFLLGAGDHSITIHVVQNPWEGGQAYLEVLTVPEPGAAALVMLGAPGWWLLRRKFRRSPAGS